MVASTSAHYPKKRCWSCRIGAPPRAWPRPELPDFGTNNSPPRTPAPRFDPPYAIFSQSVTSRFRPRHRKLERLKPQLRGRCKDRFKWSLAMFPQLSRRSDGRGFGAPPQFLRHRGVTPLGVRLRACACCARALAFPPPPRGLPSGQSRVGWGPGRALRRLVCQSAVPAAVRSSLLQGSCEGEGVAPLPRVNGLSHGLLRAGWGARGPGPRPWTHLWILALGRRWRRSRQSGRPR